MVRTSCDSTHATALYAGAGVAVGLLLKRHDWPSRVELRDMLWGKLVVSPLLAGLPGEVADCNDRAGDAPGGDDDEGGDVEA